MARFIRVTDQGFKARINIDQILSYQENRGKGQEDNYDESNTHIELTRGIFNLWEVEETVEEIDALIEGAGTTA